MSSASSEGKGRLRVRQLGGIVAALLLAAGLMTLWQPLASAEARGPEDRCSDCSNANRAPTAAKGIGDVTIVNESGTGAVSLSGVFADADNDRLTITAESSDVHTATVSVTRDYKNLTVTAWAWGRAIITVTADDGNGGTVAATFTVTVKAAPVVASPISDVASLVTEATQVVDLSRVFIDADHDPMTVTATAKSSGEGRATVSVASDDPKLMVTGVVAGKATIVVTAKDTDGNRVSDAFDVTVVKSADANLSALSLSAGSISPSFSATTYTYTLAVGNDVTGTTITATASHGRATLKAGRLGSLSSVTGGRPSAAIGLAKGSNDLQVEVTAEDGRTARTYTIRVDRKPEDQEPEDQEPGAQEPKPPQEKERDEQARETAPGPVVGLQVSAVGGTITMRWQPPNTGGAPERYIAHARPKAGDAGSGKTKYPKAGKTTVTFPNLEAGLTYKVWVRAQNAAGKGERVEATIALDAAPTEAPGPVVNLQLTAKGDSITADWEAPATGGKAAKYIVHVRPEGGGAGSGKNKHLKSKKLTVTFDRLEAGKTYQVWVRGANEIGKGERAYASITLPE